MMENGLYTTLPALDIRNIPLLNPSIYGSRSQMEGLICLVWYLLRSRLLFNHLHPTIQRRLLPDFVKAFPQARFVVSTHSPLIVGSVKDSYVYALRINENKKVISQKLDLVKEAKTASEILDEVLGVSFTMPVWAEEQLNKIVDKYSKSEVTKENFENMRNE